MKNLKNIIFVIILILVVSFVTIVINSVKAKQTKELNKLNTDLTEVAKDFYKDYYYKIVLGIFDNVRVENAKELSGDGITITLRDLAKYKFNDEDSILSRFKNYKTNEDCDYDKTKVTIYPIEPYGAEDVEVVTTVVCGF